MDDLVATGITACPSGSKAGPKGTANAAVGPQGAPLNLDVYPFVENANTLAFYLSQIEGPLQTVVHGKITNSGRKMSITIPPELRQPVGLDATLTGLDQTFSGKSRRTTSSRARLPEGQLEVRRQADVRDRPRPTARPLRATARESVAKCKK